MSDTYNQHRTKKKTPKQRRSNKTFTEYIKYTPDPVKELMNIPEFKKFIGKQDDVKSFKENLVYFLRRKFCSNISGSIEDKQEILDIISSRI